MDSPSPEDYFSAKHSLDGSGPDFSPNITVLPDRPRTPHVREGSCSGSPRLIKILPFEEVREISVPSPTSEKVAPSPSTCSRRRFSSRFDIETEIVSMVYDEYGKLGDPKKLRETQDSKDLSVVEYLRVIKKAYHHDFRDKICEVMLQDMENKASLVINDGTFKRKPNLSSWIFQVPSPRDLSQVTPDAGLTHPHPRILEIGCGEGLWCFRAKSENPTWTVHGLDDTKHWLCVHKDMEFCDFMSLGCLSKTEDYFGCVKLTDSKPEFTERNINHLLDHGNPLPTNHYSLIRGRDVFDRVESWMGFLDSARQLLQPDGVVEFIELDPRPRMPFIGPMTEVDKSHKAKACDNWTGRIEDRFEKPKDLELAINVPNWSARVETRLKAGLRPMDGVPAENLRSHLEDAGFCDVKQIIAPLSIGGKNIIGQKLKDVILWQLGLEDSIPKLKAELPEVELEEIESGKYHLNLYIVTGRKPPKLRTGDLLSDGLREEMSESKYFAMARSTDTRSIQWKRLVDRHLAGT
ncbi:hypothetical protein BGZ60DRAFT_524506 [Tricladium varicosporioides]|nr:hypothetical protein BGZ60DRAFT_524506 [Hymenoscyphus varicosporioides]